MLDMSWGELMVIGGVALIVIGPKDLPKALRTVGQMTSKVRRLASEFQSQFNEAMREAELEDVKRDLETINRDVRNSTATGFNPIQTIRDELKGAVESRPALPTSPPSEPSVARDPEIAPYSPEMAVGSIASGGTMGAGESPAAAVASTAAFAPAEEAGVPPVMAPVPVNGAGSHPVVQVSAEPLTDIAGPGLEQACPVNPPVTPHEAGPPVQARTGAQVEIEAAATSPLHERQGTVT